MNGTAKPCKTTMDPRTSGRKLRRTIEFAAICNGVRRYLGWGANDPLFRGDVYHSVHFRFDSHCAEFFFSRFASPARRSRWIDGIVDRRRAGVSLPGDCDFASVSSLWASAIIAAMRKVVYALTNQRGLVRSQGNSSWLVNLLASAKFADRDFSTEQMLQRRLMRVVGFSRVDLVLATEWRKGSKGRSYKVYFGFFGLVDPEEVEDMIERTFRDDDSIERQVTQRD